MSEPIAIVGVACRFPGNASSPSQLWDLLRDPPDVLTNIPADRLNLSRFYHANGEHHGATDVQGHAYLLSDDYTRFDASFFKINPKEAVGMDPQQRILLETVYEAFETAGYPLDAVAGSRTSVHVGVMNADYADIQLRDSETILSHHATGTTRSILSNRISYFFNLKGPSVTIDTACSSSLVALHQAVQGLRCGDANAAVVAGANLILDPSMYIAESKLRMLSPDSRSRMWDKTANGYARGEGFAAILLKPLKCALADNDVVEGIVREVCVNSDGRSPKGITNPSSAAQTSLIRETYRRAGLDPVVDRCHFFECHGTGTLAGDPVEARAIQDAFFPDQRHANSYHPPSYPLYVGSIKTVIGHLEGCAGLAGIIKALLAIKHRIIPPNLHFEELNPDIAPFYDHLEVVTSPLPWPAAPDSPLRVSVNSFGFGGTNAHAILEGFTPKLISARQGELASKSDFVGPLVFSANSEPSLVASVAAFTEHIRSRPCLDLENVAWTLQNKRSLLGNKAFFSGATRERLLQFMDRFVSEPAASGSHFGGATVNSTIEEPGILGVFTGQGAQWVSMGRGLVQSSALFRESVERCEASLAALPDPPCWSLMAELMAKEPLSRVSEAAISQPLCTAIQIGLVLILRSAGIKLDVVVGHSSGEIAAVYAADIIDARAAMQISYYRGVYAKLAAGTLGQSGKMLAVGMSYEGASEFCSRPQFEERIVVAASNSPSSVTLSGDEDAIQEAKNYFDEQKVFARLLRTDTAYHSHHMAPCSSLYLESLKACHIEVSEPRSDCTWISSVYGDPYTNDLSALKDQYWLDNLQNPVLFSQALETSIWNGGPFDVVLEIGPHPTLKGPAEQTLKAALSVAPAYAGLMRRDDDEVEAFSGAVGFVWSRLGPKYVDFNRYRTAFNLSEPALVTGLPSYCWDHQQAYWKESRISRRYRLQRDGYHELLGRRVPDDSDDSPRWRNIWRTDEIKWLKQHVFQGQILFPGAGYVVMALEAARKMAGDRPVALFELENVALTRAIVIPENSTGVEVVFSCIVVEPAEGKNSLVADFACSFCADEMANASLAKACFGRMRIVFNNNSSAILPMRPAQARDMMPVDTERFYAAMAKVGLDYRGLFSAMRTARRTFGTAAVSASWNGPDVGSEYMMHPGLLDVAFQALYVAFSSPASGHIWAPYLPVRIGRLSMRAGEAFTTSTGAIELDVDAVVDKGTSTLLAGDISVYDCRSQSPLLQIESIAMQAVSEPAPENDRLLFSSTVWTKDIMSGLTKPATGSQAQDDNQLVDALDRVSLYYWQQLVRELTQEEVQNCKWHHRLMLEAAKVAIQTTRDQQHPVAKEEWLHDSEELIRSFAKPYQDRADMRLIHVVGQNLKSAVSNDKQILEVMLQEDLLNRFYLEGYGFATMNHAISETMKQIVIKHPHTRLLEIGAGTGGTTRSILNSIGQKYSTYTYTDVSAGFFTKAADILADYTQRMVFKVLDIEKDVSAQGFDTGGYDIVIAANVLHATRCLRETMRNVRSLLKPGGYLILMEVTGLQILRSQFIMGGLPGWWYGASEGRNMSPAISELEWDELLRDTDFSGVDHILHDMHDETKHCFSLMVSQAMDARFETIREPLLGIQNIDMPHSLVLVGGKTLPGLHIVNAIQKLLTPWKRCQRVVRDVGVFQDDPPLPQSSVIVIQELDQPLFASNMTVSRMKGLQNLFASARNVLWVTSGRLARCPESNMMVGMGRSLATEIPDLVLQYLDLDHDHRTPAGDASSIVHTFLRLQATTSAASTNDDRLWTVEPEIRMIGDETWIPRVQPLDELNNMYNASRRFISQRVSPQERCVELKPSDSGLQLALRPSYPSEAPVLGCVNLQVQNTMFLAASDSESVFLCTGIIQDSGESAMSLSPRNASMLRIARERLVITHHPSTAALSTLLLAVGAHLIASTLLDWAPPQGSVVFHELPKALAQAMASKAKETQRDWIFTTFQDTSIPHLYTRLHPASTRRALKQRLPCDLAGFADFSASPAVTMSSLIPPACSTLTMDQFVTLLNQADTWRHLETASRDGLSVSEPYPVDALVVRAHDAAVSSAHGLSLCTITDWNDASPLRVRMLPLDAAHILSPTCTYLLVGMTGAIGLSLSRWMVTNGARHIALASRNPNVSSASLEDMRQCGANIQVLTVDVADKASVHSMLESIRLTMPRIAGVCNASMVLCDKLFLDMDVENLVACLRPKVEGSRVLDEAFDNEALDFFILFSSLASIMGNGGQSNYHAANLFMSSLAAKRRERGLSASIMHVGLVTDVGYVARSGVAMEERLRRLFFMPLSESDLHHSFLEAIMAGKPGSGREAELILGLEAFTNSDVAAVRPPWEHNPRFSHFVLLEANQEQQFAGSVGPANMRQELEAAETEKESMQIVEACFSRKLESMMQLRPDSVNPNVPLIDLGCDSLLAIEIRGWFVKELQVDMPVLRVLSGDTIAELCGDATKRYLASKLKSTGTSGVGESHDADSSHGVGQRVLLVQGGNDAMNEESRSETYGNSSSTLSASTVAESLTSVSEDPCPAGTSLTASSSSPQESTDVSGDSGPPPLLEQHPASYAQSRLWFLSRYLADQTTYNVTVAYEIYGQLSTAHLRLALTSVVRRHSSLRTCFFKDQSGTIMQGILAAPCWEPKVVECEGDDAGWREFNVLRTTTWDLEQGLTFGATIVSFSAGRRLLIFGYHHIVLDGVSWHVFLRDLDHAYQTKRLPTCLDYYEYSNALLGAAHNGVFDDHIKFWREQHDPLPDVLPLLPMASTTERTALRHYESHIVSRRLDAHASRGIKRASQGLRATSFHFHLAVIQTMLARLLNQNNLCIGIADANRTEERYANTVGFFLNLLPVRFVVQHDGSFKDLVRETSQKVFAALSHSAVPFDLILDALRVARSPDYSPLFQVAVNYRMGDLMERSLGDCKLVLSSVEDARNPYDLSFNITEQSSGTCLLELVAQKHLYDAAAAESLMDTYVYLLDQLSADSSVAIRDCCIVRPSAILEAVELGRGPRVRFQWPRTLSQRFDEMATKYAQDTAVKDETSTLSYAELQAKVNAIASAVIESDIKPGSRVAVLSRPSHFAVASMLAVLASGLVYVPLDHRLPQARVLTMVQDCSAELVMCHADTFSAASELHGAFGFAHGIIDVEALPKSADIVESPRRDTPEQPAFLLYTSGSTGVPKGILLSQANFRNHLALKTRELGIGREKVLQQSSLGFDMSIVQTFCALANGGMLFVASSGVRGDPVELAKLMSTSEVSFAIATPSEYLMMLRYGREYLDKCRTWKQACMGGERVPQELLREFQTLHQAPGMRLTNCYGPTEITAAATFQRLRLHAPCEELAHGQSLVGKALPNYSVYITDQSGKALPIGNAGEICIAGAGVALGYSGSVELTQTKFLPDPYATPDDRANGWTTLYRTGDRGRFMNDGSLVFMGRVDGDNQVKLHGQRIELDEVASHLRRGAPGRVLDAIVTLRGDPAFVVAHVVFAPGASMSQKELCELARSLPLPHYMIPAMTVPLEHVPVTVNGKVDRRAIAELPLPDRATTSSQVDRLTLPEAELRLLWREIVPQSDHIRPDSDFFMCGGNSLLLVKLQASIKSSMRVHVTIAKLYSASTLQRMAACISAGRTEQPPEQERIDWLSETATPSDVRSLIEDRAPEARSKMSTLHVLLTGSTSFVGNAVLVALLDQADVSVVHCVAVPAEDQKRIPRSDKVKIYVGNLLLPCLGLSEADYTALQDSTDVIIHAGSVGHCLNRFSSLRVPNLHSTHCLARLAVASAVPFHYVSSNRVTLLSGSTDLGPVSVADCFPDSDGSEGFTASKWASERLLENISHDADLEVVVHRPCAPIGSQAPSEDALNALLKFSSAMRTLPRFGNFEGYFDFKDVGAIAGDIVREALRAPTDRSTPIRFVHHSSGQRLPVAQLRQHMQEVHAVAFHEVAVDEWIERATVAGIDPCIATYLDAIVSRQEKIRFPYMGALVEI